MYGIGGERDLTESTLDHLSGYEGAKPVRIGNAAYDQRQNDVYGALLDSVYIHAKVQDHLPQELWEALCRQVEIGDRGVGEARPGNLGGARRSQALRLLEADVLGRARPRLPAGRPDRRRGPARALDEGREADPRGHPRAAASPTAASSASTTRPTPSTPPPCWSPWSASCRPDDERVVNTVKAIDEELTENGLVLRYRVDETDDGLTARRRASLICSFWLVSALSEIGERRAAREMCERLLSIAGPLGLYAEELDARTGRHWGNFPQAFTHLALINAVSHVITDDRATGDREVTAVLSEMISQPDG